MQIKVLGMGCSNCKKLENNVKQAVKEMNVDAEVIKVENMKDIMAYGVMRTPAVVINEKVKSFGKVCTVEDVKKFIEDEK
ncbi:thioredoxin family protein [Clostridium ganghwense]|uniref:Thioredoxin family protein n=1 Tax=Clostridium ganghwense TaxID=312089 RepID=A0ABT4CMC2_9CLOT|nr:thioredoxin family protein [Clostridium ganghwense]MCY6370191.1 thioredoxin family protein [Clostridium ganghwense]